MSIPTHPVTGEPTRLHNPGDPNPQGAAPGNTAALARLGLVDGEPSGPERRSVEQPAPFTPDAGITDPGRYTSREEWHENGTPEHIAALWERVLELAREVTKARKWVRPDFIDSEKRAEGRRAAEAARQALEAGRQPEPAAATDWAAETLTREALWRALSAQLRDARQAYDDAVEEGLLEWRDSLTADLETMQAKARAQVTAAAATLRAWRQAVRAAESLERVRDPKRVTRNTEYKTREAQDVLNGGGDMSGPLALVNSDDPIVTGAWISSPDSDIEPPVHIRRAMNDSTNTVQYLAHIEAAEDYQVTNFTERDFRGRVAAPDNSPTGPYGYRAV